MMRTLFTNAQHQDLIASESRPDVSIIIPCYNAAWALPTLAKSLEAVLAPNIEVIFVDDGSTDDSLRMFQSLVPRAICLQQSNHGLGFTRNRAVEMATGEFLQLLDADDTIEPGKIETQVAFAQKRNLDVVYSDWRMIIAHDQDEVRKPFVQAEAPTEIVESLLGGWWFPPNAAVIRKSAFMAVGGCDPHLGNTCEDFDLWVRLGIAGYHYGYVPGQFANYYRYENIRSMSRKNAREFFEGEEKIIFKAIRLLEEKQALSPEYCKSAARRLHHITRNVYSLDPDWFGRLLKEVYRLDPDFKPSGSWDYKIAAKSLGLRKAERLALWKRRWKSDSESSDGAA